MIMVLYMYINWPQVLSRFSSKGVLLVTTVQFDCMYHFNRSPQKLTFQGYTEISVLFSKNS